MMEEIHMSNASDFIIENGVLKKESKNVSYVLGEEYDSGGAGIITSVADYAKFCADNKFSASYICFRQISCRIELHRDNRILCRL